MFYVFLNVFTLMFLLPCVFFNCVLTLKTYVCVTTTYVKPVHAVIPRLMGQGYPHDLYNILNKNQPRYTQLLVVVMKLLGASRAGHGAGPATN